MSRHRNIRNKKYSTDNLSDEDYDYSESESDEEYYKKPAQKQPSTAQTGQPSSLHQLLNSRVETQPPPQPAIFKDAKLSDLTRHVGESEIKPYHFQDLSPDDIVLQQQGKAFQKKKDESPLQSKPKPTQPAAGGAPTPLPKFQSRGGDQPPLKFQSRGGDQPPLKFQGKARVPDQQKAKPQGQPQLQSTGGSAKNSPVPQRANSPVVTEIKFTSNSPSTPKPQKVSDAAAIAQADDDFMMSPSRSLEIKRAKQNTDSKRKEVLDKINAEIADKDRKAHLSLVVIGHVDAGKSTIMGHLLYLSGHVSEKTMNRYTKDSQQMGKGSFSFAWVLDEHGEERERGVTIDVAVSSLQTKTKQITLLDAPGHRDFIPNMISGAAMADVAVLVLDSSGTEFERGFKDDGQTKEHVQLAKSLGVSFLIVALNKLDLCDWSEDRYNSIVEQMKPFLKKSGFPPSAFTFLPCSGLMGENLTSTKAELLKAWYTGPTLMDAIDALKPPERVVDQPLRMVVSDVYKDPQSGLGIAVGGRVEAGYLSKGDQVLVLPVNEICSIKAIRFQSDNVDYSYCGRNVDIGLNNIPITSLSVGSVLCDPMDPVPLVRVFEAQIMTFASQRPILRGAQVTLHLQSINEPACISKLISLVDAKSGEIKQKKPKCLGPGVVAHVVIRLERPICLELYSKFKSLGRFSVRDCGRTLAAGIVTKILVQDGI